MALLRPADDAAIAEAALRLARGGLLGLPTETVYGLAADMNNDAAVQRIFAAKGRPADHPLIAHVACAADGDWARALAPLVQSVPQWAEAALHQLWPGALSVVLARRPGVCTAAAGARPTLAVRCPAHPVAQAVLRAAAALGVNGLAAPSANRFGRVSPTTAAHVMAEFDPVLSADALLVLDGGACAVGIESTIIDLSRDHPVLLRPGTLTRAELEQAFGRALADADADAPRVSGTLAAHYAPQARLTLVARSDWDSRWSQLSAAQRARSAVYAPGDWTCSGAALALPMPAHALACAHELFAVLRQLDQAAIDRIWVAQPPADAHWAGVTDRLQRAAA